MLEVGRNIQRKSMQRSEARKSNADGGDLALRYAVRADPNTRCTGVAQARQRVVGKSVDDALLEPAHIRMDLETEPRKIENRIRHQLSGAVISHIATAVGFDALDAVTREHFIASEYMRGGTDAFGDGDDGRVVLEQKHGHGSALLAAGHKLLVRLALECKCVGVGDAPEVHHAKLVMFGERLHHAQAYGASMIPYNRAMPKIHPTAIVEGMNTGDITLADDVEIGPYCVLRGKIELGAGTVLIANVHLQGPLRMGAGNACYPGVAIGFAPQDKGFHHAKDGAGIVIGDANSFREHVTIHRATRDDRPTRVGDRNFWMACSHAAHDVQVASDCVFANNTLFAGHAEIGDRVVTGGGAGIHQFTRIGRGAMIGGLCGASKDVCPFHTVTATNYVGGYNRIGMRRGGASPSDIEMARTIYGILVRDRKPYAQRVAALEALAGHPIADEYIAFVKASKRGIATRHGRATHARSGQIAGSDAGSEASSDASSRASSRASSLASSLASPSSPTRTT